MSVARHRGSPRTALLFAVLAAALTWFTMPSAGAKGAVEVTVDQVGWWSSNPASPPAGEGGFEVSAAPDRSVQSLAAIQLTFAATQVDSAQVTLTESAAAGAELGTLAVCTTDESWEAEDPGARGDAPKQDCSEKINLTRVEGEGTWLGDIASLVSDGGTVSIVILPEHTPPTPAGTGMVVRIGEIELTATGSSPTPPTTSGDLTPSGGDSGGFFDPGPSSGGDTSFGGGSSFDGGSFDVPADSGGAVDPGPTGDPGADTPAAADDAGAITEDDGFFALDPIDEVATDGRPWIRLLLFVPLSAGIGFGSVHLRHFLEDRRLALLGGP